MKTAYQESGTGLNKVYTEVMILLLLLRTHSRLNLVATGLILAGTFLISILIFASVLKKCKTNTVSTLPTHNKATTHERIKFYARPRPIEIFVTFLLLLVNSFYMPRTEFLLGLFGSLFYQ